MTEAIGRLALLCVVRLALFCVTFYYSPVAEASSIRHIKHHRDIPRTVFLDAGGPGNIFDYSDFFYSVPNPVRPGAPIDDATGS